MFASPSILRPIILNTFTYCCYGNHRCHQINQDWTLIEYKLKVIFIWVYMSLYLYCNIFRVIVWEMQQRFWCKLIKKGCVTGQNHFGESYEHMLTPRMSFELQCLHGILLEDRLYILYITLILESRIARIAKMAERCWSHQSNTSTVVEFYIFRFVKKYNFPSNALL